jgi:hypothetical protein
VSAAHDAPGAQASDHDRPPLGSWGRLYALVIAWLVVDIALLTLLTRSFG